MAAQKDKGNKTPQGGGDLEESFFTEDEDSVHIDLTDLNSTAYNKVVSKIQDQYEIVKDGNASAGSSTRPPAPVKRITVSARITVQVREKPGGTVKKNNLLSKNKPALPVTKGNDKNKKNAAAGGDKEKQKGKSKNLRTTSSRKRIKVGKSNQMKLDKKAAAKKEQELQKRQVDAVLGQLKHFTEQNGKNTEITDEMEEEFRGALGMMLCYMDAIVTGNGNAKDLADVRNELRDETMKFHNLLKAVGPRNSVDRRKWACHSLDALEAASDVLQGWKRTCFNPLKETLDDPVVQSVFDAYEKRKTSSSMKMTEAMKEDLTQAVRRMRKYFLDAVENWTDEHETSITETQNKLKKALRDFRDVCRAIKISEREVPPLCESVTKACTHVVIGIFRTQIDWNMESAEFREEVTRKYEEFRQEAGLSEESRYKLQKYPILV